MLEVQTDRGEQQRKRDCERNNQCAAQVSQEHKQDHRNQYDSFGEVVQHRVGGQMHQIAAIQVRNDFYAGRQEVLVEKIHFFVKRLQSVIRILPLAQQDNS